MTSLESGSELRALFKGMAAPGLGWPVGEGVERGKKKEMGRLGREAAKAEGGRGH